MDDGVEPDEPRQVWRIVIELGVDDGLLTVKPTENAIQSLGMITLATADIIAMLRHHVDENKGGKIIIPKLRLD